MDINQLTTALKELEREAWLRVSEIQSIFRSERGSGGDMLQRIEQEGMAKAFGLVLELIAAHNGREDVR